MASRRTAKVNEAIRETVSTTILFGLKDPRVKNVTVLGAEVSPDLRTAKVYVSVMGDVKTQTLSMHGLNAAKGFIQAKVAERLQTRYTPVLRFILDPSVKLSIQASEILHQVLGEHSTETMADAEAADQAGVTAANADSDEVHGSDAELDADEDDSHGADSAADDNQDSSRPGELRR